MTLRALLGAAPDWVDGTIPGAFQTMYLERRSDYRLTAEERQAKLARVGQDGAWLLDALASEAGAALRGLAAVGTLATIWQQRDERVDGRVRWRTTTVDSTELLVTPHDPGVRAGQKRGWRWRGDKVHITETIAEPPDPDEAADRADPADQVRFITDVTTSPAPSGDGEELRRAAAARHTVDDDERIRIERYLNRGIGPTWLADPQVAGVVEDALQFFDSRRYRLHAWVVMPNHVHVVITPHADVSVSGIVSSSKSFTAKRANALLERQGAFWQEDYFDRFIRDERHFEAALHYVEANPVVAGLCAMPEDWMFSSARHRHGRG